MTHINLICSLSTRKNFTGSTEAHTLVSLIRESSLIGFVRGSCTLWNFRNFLNFLLIPQMVVEWPVFVSFRPLCMWIFYLSTVTATYINSAGRGTLVQLYSWSYVTTKSPILHRSTAIAVNFLKTLFFFTTSSLSQEALNRIPLIAFSFYYFIQWKHFCYFDCISNFKLVDCYHPTCVEILNYEPNILLLICLCIYLVG